MSYGSADVPADSARRPSRAPLRRQPYRDVRPWMTERADWEHRRVFVGQEITVPIGARAAQARFENLAHGTWLREVSDAAYSEGLTGQLKVGPGGPVASKLVSVTVLDSVYRGDVMSVGVRWEATGLAGALFPVLDATIAISPGEDDGNPERKESARLELAGSYRPPLGRLGAALDQAVLHRIATATIRSLLRSVAAALTGEAPASAVDDLGLHSAPETGTT
jgi:hypothetical protein